MAVCKIMSREDWDQTFGSGQDYTARIEADVNDGFIHCSTDQQLAKTLNRWYTDADEVFVAVIDEEKLTSELKWEPNFEGELFPHIYGPIDIGAAAGAYEVTRDETGAWQIPAELTG